MQTRAVLTSSPACNQLAHFSNAVLTLVADEKGIWPSLGLSCLARRAVPEAVCSTKRRIAASVGFPATMWRATQTMHAGQTKPPGTDTRATDKRQQASRVCGFACMDDPTVTEHQSIPWCVNDDLVRHHPTTNCKRRHAHSAGLPSCRKRVSRTIDHGAIVSNLRRVAKGEGP
jgi:hypothetical protein